MSVQSRDAKVFAALLVSMLTGAIALMVLGNNPPSAGAFCLSGYYRLDPVEKVISSRAAPLPGLWDRIEVYYSGTEAGYLKQLASLNDLDCPKDINCHFVICNGRVGRDGQIQSTEKWQRQQPITPESIRHKVGQAIRICIMADPHKAGPTDFQIKRVEALTEQLCRKFGIQPESIHYPDDWQ